MRKKLINLTILIVGVGLIISLSRDILRLLKAGDRIKQSQVRVEELEKKNRELAGLKAYYESEEFIEQQARNKLNLSKKGETVVVLPENVEELIDYQPPGELEKDPSWRQWWNLFF
jgi:cell division protein FtsB